MVEHEYVRAQRHFFVTRVPPVRVVCITFRRPSAVTKEKLFFWVSSRTPLRARLRVYASARRRPDEGRDMNNALGVARAVRTRRKCRRDSHAAGGVFPAGKENARWNRISRNASATRAENDSSRRAESLDARPSTLVPPVSASSPCRPRESSSSSEEQTSSKSDSDSESVSSKPPLRVASARAGSGEKTPSDPRRREPSGPAGRDEGASPRSTIFSARDGGECHREVSGVSGSALGGFPVCWMRDGFRMRSRARLSERDGDEGKRAGTYLRSAFPRELRGGRSARTRMSGRKRSWFTAGLFFVHRHVRHGPLLRQRWGGREQSVQVAFWQRSRRHRR